MRKKITFKKDFPKRRGIHNGIPREHGVSPMHLKCDPFSGIQFTLSYALTRESKPWYQGQTEEWEDIPHVRIVTFFFFFQHPWPWGLWAGRSDDQENPGDYTDLIFQTADPNAPADPCKCGHKIRERKTDKNIGARPANLQWLNLTVSMGLNPQSHASVFQSFFHYEPSRKLSGFLF